MRLVLPATLLASATLLSAAIAYALTAPIDPADLAVAPIVRHAPRLVPQPAYAPPPEDSIAEIDARPLFASGRKPLVDSTLANGPVGQPSDIALVGVIMDGDRAVALLRSKSTSLSSSAVVGGVVNGWRVAKIDATSVTLRSATGDYVVALEGPSDRPPSMPLQPAQSDWSVGAAPPPAPQSNQPVLSATPAARVAPAPLLPSQPFQPALPTKPQPKNHWEGTIAPEALKGAPRDPQTGEPTL